MIPKKIETSRILKIIRGLTDVDLIIIEGVRDIEIPKIRLGDIEERKNTILTYDGKFDNLLNRVIHLVRKKEN